MDIVDNNKISNNVLNESSLNLSSSSFSSVSVIGLSKLSDEPTRIQNEIDNLQISIDRISIENFSIHVDAHNAVNSIVDESIPVIQKSFNSLSSNVLPNLNNAIENFKLNANKVYLAHKRNQQALSLHTQLLDLLVLPHLLDTCIRRGLFDDALDLSSFALTLQRRHSAISQGLIAIENSSKVNNNTKKNEENNNYVTPSNDLSKSKKHIENIQSLEPAPGSGVEIIHSIVREVEASTASMRQQLLQQLRTQINLPTCLRIIGYLKRLDAQERFKIEIEEQNSHLIDPLSLQPTPDRLNNDENITQTAPSNSALRHEFLECRDAYIRTLALQDALVTSNLAPGLLSDGFSEKDKPYQAIIKIIERNRVTLFDVITQYKSIFFTTGNTSSSFSFSLDNSDIQGIVEDGGILARWVDIKINEFLVLLEAYISRIRDCGSIADILTRSMYFGTSLAKVGADFRPLLTPIFVKRLCIIMKDYHWAPSFSSIKRDIESGNWGESLPLATASTIINSSTNKSNKHQKDDNIIAEDSTISAKKIDHYKPPIELLEFPILAELANSLLRSFNELRQCAIFSAVPILIDYLDNLFQENIYNGIEEYKNRNINIIEPQKGVIPQSLSKEQEQFINLCRRVSDDLFPYISICFDAIFGISSGKGKKCLNLDSIGKNILKLMPPIPAPKYSIPEISNIVIPTPNPTPTLDISPNPTPILENNVEQNQDSQSNSNSNENENENENNKEIPTNQNDVEIVETSKISSNDEDISS